jgi:hypothetical protein
MESCKTYSTYEYSKVKHTYISVAIVETRIRASQSGTLALLIRDAYNKVPFRAATHTHTQRPIASYMHAL